MNQTSSQHSFVAPLAFACRKPAFLPRPAFESEWSKKTKRDGIRRPSARQRRAGNKRVHRRHRGQGSVGLLLEASLIYCKNRQREQHPTVRRADRVRTSSNRALRDQDG